MNQIIPLTNAPNQTLSIGLTVDGEALTLNLVIRYNEIAQYWMMQVKDVNNVLLLAGIPLLTGVFPSANILGQYRYLKIGSAYVLNMSNIQTLDYPNSETLGTDFVLLWSDNA